jgi:hypothetical protein
MQMINLKRILLIDDECSLFKEELTKDFEKNEIYIEFCETREQAEALINSGTDFDLIILDWILDGETNILSRLFLNHLKKNSFIPVFIWSNHLEDFKSSIEMGHITYPEKMITGVTKDDVTPKVIREKVSGWFQGLLAAQLGGIYRTKLRKGLEKIFFELVELPNYDIASILKAIVGSDDNIDWSNDFILGLLHRELIKDTEFSRNLEQVINNAARVVTKKKPEEHKKVLNKIMYYETNSDTIQCGDIIRISDNENLTLCGIIVSPKCDLAQKNTRFLEIIVLKEFQDDTLAMNSDIRRSIKRQNEPSFYLFPALKIENKFQDMVAVLKSKIILEHAPGESIENQIRYPKALKRLEYSDTFLYRGNHDKKQHLELLCSLDEPYKSDFLQRVQSHNSRVGIPDIRDLI